MKNTIDIGIHNSGQVTITYTLTEEGCFSALGSYWDKYHGYTHRGGQVLDEIVEDFPDSDIARRIHKVWKRWHLNDLTAGSPRQESALREWRKNHEYTYDEASKFLTSVGLNPDSEFLHNDEPYKYGYACLKEELPEDVIEEILSWENL